MANKFIVREADIDRFVSASSGTLIKRKQPDDTVEILTKARINDKDVWVTMLKLKPTKR